MIKSFSQKETEDFWGTGKSRKFPQALQRRILDRLQILDAVTGIDQLRVPPSNNLEKLVGDRKGYWSIRVNMQFRIVFRFEGGHAYDVSLIDYH